MIIQPIREKWKGAMSDRERFVNQLNYKSFDRCFNMEFGYWEENFQQWKIFRDNGIKTNDQADQFFNFDKIKIIEGNWWMNPVFQSQLIEETDTTKIMINSDGVFEEIPRDGHEALPRYIRSSVSTPEDWKRIKTERFRLDDPERQLNIEQLKKEHPEDRDYPLGIHTGSMIGKIRDLLSFEGLAYAIYDYPDMVEDMVETCCRIVEDLLDQLLPHFSFDFASGWEDIAFKNGPIVSVDFFKTVIVPRYQRIKKKLAADGVGLWYIDCDGDVRPLLPYFLEAGVNCMFPHEVNGSGFPGDLLDQYGPELRIMGGVDKMELIKGKDAIKKYLESILPWVEKGGFIPFCDHRCPPDVTEEDYLYYSDLKEQLFGMG
ncbi:MAG: uroporphyrinogen decarboxylase family protein [bacterium]|nr:uroporphyrinogen decarboxylase family protein [bacterium]